MPDSSVVEIMDAMATQMENVLCGTANPLIEQLQVVSTMMVNPSPPSIDVYPAEDFAPQIGYGIGNRELRFVVRARVHTADPEAGQELLLSMMDPREDTSVEGALLASPTLGGVVEDLAIVEQSGFGLFPYPQDPEGGSLIGATWTVQVTP